MNLSLQLVSLGHESKACITMLTTILAPGITTPWLGLTQYWRGAVVFILNATISLLLFVRDKALWIFFFSSTAHQEQHVHGIPWLLSQKKRAQNHGVALLSPLLSSHPKVRQPRIVCNIKSMVIDRFAHSPRQTCTENLSLMLHVLGKLRTEGSMFNSPSAMFERGGERRALKKVESSRARVGVKL